MNKETYLGDAVYASFDGYQIKLRTTNGIETTNEIYLEPETFNNLVKWKRALSEESNNG